MPKINAILGNTPTPTGSSITEVVIEYKGQATTEVPAGERFEVYARGVAANPGALVWEVLYTMISTDGTIACYNPTDASGSSYTTPRVKVTANSISGKEPIMPNKDITLRIKLWGNDHRGMTLPPISEW